MDLQFGSNWVLVNTSIDLKTGREIWRKVKVRKQQAETDPQAVKKQASKLTKPPTTHELVQGIAVLSL